MKTRYLRMLDGMYRKSGAKDPPDWSVYIVRCADGTLYTGVAKDVSARLRLHNAGRGAAYTSTRAPVKLLHREDRLSRSQALVREARIKRMSRSEKKALACG